MIPAVLFRGLIAGSGVALVACHLWFSRGLSSVNKRYKIQAAVRNLGLVMRAMFGIGKSRCLQGGFRTMFCWVVDSFIAVELVLIRISFTPIFGIPIRRPNRKNRRLTTKSRMDTNRMGLTRKARQDARSWRA